MAARRATHRKPKPRAVRTTKGAAVPGGKPGTADVDLRGFKPTARVLVSRDLGAIQDGDRLTEQASVSRD